MGVTILGGLCVGFSQLMMKESFGLAPSMSGPLCAVISSDVIIVSTFCHFVYSELMNWKQVTAVMSIVTGLGIMAVSSGSHSGIGPAAADSILAFALAVLGMIFFANAVLSVRVGCLGNLAAWSGFVVRMLVMLVIGAAALTHSVMKVGWPNTGLGALAAPAAAGVLQAGGVLCVNKALQYPNTGIANAIFASNSLDVLVLNFVVFGLVPSGGSLVGMSVVVAAVVGISILEGTEPEPSLETPKHVASPWDLDPKSLSSPHLDLWSPKV